MRSCIQKSRMCGACADLSLLSRRSIESAEWFRMGYYGRQYANVSTVELIAEDDITFSPITPMDSTYLPSWQV